MTIDEKSVQIGHRTFVRGSAPRSVIWTSDRHFQWREAARGFQYAAQGSDIWSAEHYSTEFSPVLRQAIALLWPETTTPSKQSVQIGAFTFAQGTEPGSVTWGSRHVEMRVRNGGREWTKTGTGEWTSYPCPMLIPTELEAAIAQLWPSAADEVPFPERVFDSGNDAYTWIRGEAVGTVQRKFLKSGQPGMFTWRRHEVKVGPDGLKEALDYYWPLTPKAEPKEFTAPTEVGVVAARHTKPDVHWSFRCRPEDVDLGRILREAYAAGAREVTVSRDGESWTYLEKRALGWVQAWWVTTQSGGYLDQSFFDLKIGPVLGDESWTLMRRPLLAQARAWAAEQEARMKAAEAATVRVAVTGVK